MESNSILLLAIPSCTCGSTEDDCSFWGFLKKMTDHGQYLRYREWGKGEKNFKN